MSKRIHSSLPSRETKTSRTFYQLPKHYLLSCQWPSRHPLNVSSGEDGTAQPLHGIQLKPEDITHNPTAQIRKPGQWCNCSGNKDMFWYKICSTSKQHQGWCADPRDQYFRSTLFWVYLQSIFICEQKEGPLSQISNLYIIFSFALKCHCEKRNAHILR